MTGNVLLLLEEELIDKAGPLGKFVLQKQIKNMGYTPQDFPESKLLPLITEVVKKAFFNQELWPQMVSELKRKVIHQ